MMIVATHNGDVQYAYKGGFNPELGTNWQGTNFVPKHDYLSIVDKCNSGAGTPPEPVSPSDSHAIAGVTFDKANYDNHHGNCDSDRYGNDGSDCRWENCNPGFTHTQMSLWVYVRGATTASEDATCKVAKDTGVLTSDSQYKLADGKTTFCANSPVLDGGGWTMVWKHAYGEACPNSAGATACASQSKYSTFSSEYTPCTSSSKFCNLPNKNTYASAGEQMIVAYHNGEVQYAYKGGFNPMMDSDWTGTNFVDKHSFTQIVDKCSSGHGIPPEPVHPSDSHGVGGVTFDKANYNNHHGNCDSDRYGNDGSDCRWENCNPQGIGTHTQMTIAVFVR
jgi:hypothetical protein